MFREHSNNKAPNAGRTHGAPAGRASASPRCQVETSTLKNTQRFSFLQAAVNMHACTHAHTGTHACAQHVHRDAPAATPQPHLHLRDRSSPAHTPCSQQRALFSDTAASAFSHVGRLAGEFLQPRWHFYGSARAVIYSVRKTGPSSYLCTGLPPGGMAGWVGRVPRRCPEGRLTSSG